LFVKDLDAVVLRFSVESVPEHSLHTGTPDRRLHQSRLQ
jgi:hypothetical protein